MGCFTVSADLRNSAGDRYTPIVATGDVEEEEDPAEVSPCGFRIFASRPSIVRILEPGRPVVATTRFSRNSGINGGNLFPRINVPREARNMSFFEAFSSAASAACCSLARLRDGVAGVMAVEGGGAMESENTCEGNAAAA